MSFLRRIIHNDAIKLDPPEVYNWRVFALAAAVSQINMRRSENPSDEVVQACFGGTLFGMDIGIIGGVLTLPDFKEYDIYSDFTIFTCSDL